MADGRTHALADGRRRAGGRRWAAVGVLGLWTLVSLAHLMRLLEPPSQPPGQEVAPLLAALRAQIPPAAGYLYVQPGAFGTDTGVGPRLRYELFPRRYQDARAADDETAVRELMRHEAITFVVVPDARLYPPTHWLRQERAWLRPLQLSSSDAYLLVAAP